jgi:hypothetical protein
MVVDMRVRNEYDSTLASIVKWRVDGLDVRIDSVALRERGRQHLAMTSEHAKPQVRPEYKPRRFS